MFKLNYFTIIRFDIDSTWFHIPDYGDKDIFIEAVNCL